MRELLQWGGNRGSRLCVSSLEPSCHSYPISKMEICIILALLSGAVLRSQRDDGNKRALKNKEKFYKLSQLWPVGASSNWLAGPFDLTLIICDSFLAFCYDKILYFVFLILYSLHKIWNQPFFKEVLCF